MLKDNSAMPRASLGSRLPLLVALFVASGAAALIYEIVWFQLLELVIGSSALSLGVLLATFMGGMCLGSLLLPRVVGANRHALAVYAGIELGVGACGLLVLPKTGHAINLEEPEAFNRAIAEFLAQVIAGRWEPRDPRARPDALLKTS